MIDTIYNTGTDALDNEWELFIPSFPGVLDLDNTIIRVTDFSLPETSVDFYTVEYKTQTMTKPKGKIKTPNTFTFSFRLDKYYKVYEGFENWLKAIINPDTGAMGVDGLPGAESALRIPIDIIPIDANGATTKKGWQFTGSIISQLDGLEFKHTGEPLLSKVTMNFIKKIQRT